MATLLESRKSAVQKQFDALTKEKDDLAEQRKTLEQRINEINVEIVRLQGRFAEIGDLEKVGGLETKDKGLEKLEDSK